MQNEPEYLIPSTPRRSVALLFIGTFICAFFFMLGIALGTITFSPLLDSNVLGAKDTTSDHLPPSSERIIPFSTPAPDPVIAPYPVQIPINPPYNPAEATTNWIRIPTIGVAVPVIQSASIADTDVIATLDKGAALYPNGVRPGAIGNVFISAHSTGEPWRGPYRFAFIRINELKLGDSVHIDWQGARYSYRITKNEIVTPTADFRVISDRPVPTISIMACWPLWSTKSRMLVHGELTNITQLTRPIAL
ncbi:MAG: hypothetical protein A3C02_04425 [Candidatus Andersenbacteria bacterium RIFCSPHIGHO2_02_FULL_45_11]|uniref:Sortase n=1 Tax=Candidatus Andersenbacteria bacterium RIFCSPHIGHO2_12_FULL_45_11 TaxID=1797281 RepID=A0A1G1X2Y8_9BACT|nr:MAG: hypothetical protein A2805_02785 [Candidatus Andersenbacteria bacterium RIFCSPHIGHO2_01_FULL_46_36]OGY32155.1 MAG: hypothetical protein A3C02_04425 [Candidatus Andersenbacteria bacterium RIFCSPHIGHO2_02_FULL_45_11]OGY34304.1 MAG: hypothetical protein A3D99_04525 [Candidatus Andersenbacteria bacterium RIFCSPHIGHO2_12_FULL_45_11]